MRCLQYCNKFNSNTFIVISILSLAIEGLLGAKEIMFCYVIFFFLHYFK